MTDRGHLPARPNAPSWAGLLLCELIVLQAAAVAAAMSPWMRGDTTSYLELAAGLDQGFLGTMTAEGMQPDPLRPPGYPIVLWFFLRGLGMPLATVLLFQVIAYLGILLIIDRFIRSNGASPTSFRLLAAIYPFAAAYCAGIMTEAWTMLLVTMIALLANREWLAPRQALIVGLLCGVAILFRADLLLLPALVAGVLLWRGMHKGRAREGFKSALLLLLAASAAVAPYATWNFANFGKFSPVPVAAAVGNSLYTATWQNEVPLEDLNAFYGGRITARAVESGYVSEVAALNRSFGAPALTPPDNPFYYPTLKTRIESNVVFGRAAIERIIAKPDRYALHLLNNVWMLWNTKEYPGSVPAAAKLALMLVSYGVCLAGAWGVWLTLAGKAPIPVRASTALIMLYPFLVHLPGHSEARYTAAARPLLLLFAAIAVAWLVKHFRSSTAEPT